jgi:hypothetical protein
LFGQGLAFITAATDGRECQPVDIIEDMTGIAAAVLAGTDYSHAQFACRLSHGQPLIIL